MITTQQVQELESRHVLQTYKRQPLVLARGEGRHLYDIEGRAYLDFLSGIGVVVLGQLVPPSGLAGGSVDAALWIARTAVGAAWLGIAWASLRRTLEEERRRIDSFEHVLIDATREQRDEDGVGVWNDRDAGLAQ